MATEKRDLIDRRRLLRDPYFQEGRYPESGLLRMAIGEQPRVDAVEVVHGEWEIIEDAYFDLVELKCSVCCEAFGFEDYEDCIPQNYHYCPNCGAKMDGERRT